MFIVKKKIKGKDYYYLRESHRENGKVKTKDIAYLGKSREEAENQMKEILKKRDGKENEMVEKKEVSKDVKGEFSIEDMAAFCKRKGFVYASGDLYGGLAGFWDFGPLGVELKNNIKKAWWKFHVHSRKDIVGIDGSIVTNPKVWEASGHVGNFVDVEVRDKKTGKVEKRDKFEVDGLDKSRYEIVGEFNPMFTTQVGPGSESIEAYLRPETAQLIFADFKSVQENARMKLPFGIAQVGKSFRNEIAPRNFLFRSREFEQMEIEYFVHPDRKDDCPYIKEVENYELNVYSSDMQEKGKEPVKMKVKDALKEGIIKLPWHGYWLATEVGWFENLGANMKRFRIRQHLKDEKSHYATDTWDVEYEFPFGWRELQGIADRGCYDLSQHEKHSKKDLKIMDEESGKKVLPEVISEPSLGVERAFLVFMFDAYFYDEKRENVVLKLNPKLAPVKAAVFPLVKNDHRLVKIAEEVYNELKEEWNVIYDKSGSVGRRYARNDEVGTPFCITVDSNSVKGKDVTIRERDTTKQVRVKIVDLKDVLRKLISGDLEFVKAGKLVK